MQNTTGGTKPTKSIEWLLARARAHQGAGSSGTAAVAHIINAAAAAAAAIADSRLDQDAARRTPRVHE